MRLRHAFKALQIVAIVFFCLLLIANLYRIADRLLFKTALPKIFGFAQVIVMSGSMQPALNVGDMLIIHEQNSYELQDIITYQDGQTLVTHRVVEAFPSDGDRYVTKGDFNNVSDEPITGTAIEGKVVLRIPEFGNAILFISSPPGLLIVSLAVFGLIELPFLIERLKHLRK